MNHRQAWLVRYRLIPAEGSIAVYTRQFLGPEACWADPDVEHAGAWMKRLATDAEFRALMGKRAAESITEFMRLGEEGIFADELCAILENRRFLPRRPPLSEQDYSRLRELAFEQSASVA